MSRITNGQRSWAVRACATNPGQPRRARTRALWSAALLLGVFGGFCNAGAAGPTTSAAVKTAASKQESYRVSVNKSIVATVSRSVGRVAVGNPGVADVIVLRSRELYVVGKALGSTNVVAWDADGDVIAILNVEVTHDLESLKVKLHELLPGEKINVYSAEERLILSGEVSSLAKMDVARELASGFMPDCVAAQSDAGSVLGGQSAGSGSKAKPADVSCKKATLVNLMQVGGAQQVMLKVTVAEMARTVVKRLNAQMNFFNLSDRLSGGAVQGGASLPPALDPQGLMTPTLGQLDASSGVIGPPVQLLMPNTPTIDSSGLFLSYLRGNFLLDAVLDISRRNGLAKILSEPTLTTLTGQEAQFVSGGEFPMPVPQGGASNATTIEFKEFGVGVHFIPVVLDSGRINLKLKVSVSDVSTLNNVAVVAQGTTSTFVIPSLTKRSASSTVELSDGQTIGIAGLINDSVRESVSKFPGLGDIPLLGMLFRSQEFISGQTELVIFVTPRLARPIAPSEVRLPTDSFVPPSELDFYLTGRMEGSGKKATRSAPSSAAPRDPPPKANFGHDL